MKRIAAGLAVGVSATIAYTATTAATNPSGERAGSVVRVAVFQVASSAVLDRIVDGFKASFIDTTGLEGGQVEFIDRNAQGDPSLIQPIARELSEAHVDMIAVLGTPAVLAQTQAETETPVIAMAMGDPVDGGVAASLDAPGRNVTGSIDYIDPARLVDEILAVEPGLRRLGTVVEPANDNMRLWLDDLRAAVARRGLHLVEAPIGASADVATAARSLGGRVEALLTGPDTTVISSIDAVAQFAVKEGLSLYGVGLDAATPGVLASIGPDYHEVGRLAGQAAADVHRGVDPGRVPFRRPGSLQLVVNTARAAALSLPLTPAGSGRAMLLEAVS